MEVLYLPKRFSFFPKMELLPRVLWEVQLAQNSPPRSIALVPNWSNMGAGPVIGPRWVHQGPKRLYCITTIAEAPASSGFCLPWGLALRDCWAIFFWYLDCFKQSEIDMTALICTVTTAPRVFRSVLTKGASGGSNTPISLVTFTKLVVYRSPYKATQIVLSDASRSDCMHPCAQIWQSDGASGKKVSFFSMEANTSISMSRQLIL